MVDAIEYPWVTYEISCGNCEALVEVTLDIESAVVEPKFGAVRQRLEILKK